MAFGLFFSIISPVLTLRVQPMNNSGEVQKVINASQDTAPVLKAMSVPDKPLDIPLEQSRLIPFDPDMWESWSD